MSSWQLMVRTIICLIVLLNLSFFVQSVSGQAVRNGLGDATTIITPDKIYSSNGNPGEIGNFSGSSLGQDSGDFATRHLRSGNASGIGGSFLGTGNVTAESSPLRRSYAQEPTVRAVMPAARAQEIPFHVFSETITKQHVSTTVPQLMPDVSDQWNPSSITPAINAPLSQMDIQLAHPKEKTSRESIGIPSFSF